MSPTAAKRRTQPTPLHARGSSCHVTAQNTRTTAPGAETGRRPAASAGDVICQLCAGVAAQLALPGRAGAARAVPPTARAGCRQRNTTNERRGANPGAVRPQRDASVSASMPPSPRPLPARAAHAGRRPGRAAAGFPGRRRSFPRGIRPDERHRAPHRRGRWASHPEAAEVIQGASPTVRYPKALALIPGQGRQSLAEEQSLAHTVTPRHARRSGK